VGCDQINPGRAGIAGRDFRLTDVGGRVIHDWLA